MRPCAQLHIPRTAGTSITHGLGLEKIYEPEIFSKLFSDIEYADEFGIAFKNFSIGHILLTSIEHFSYFISGRLVFSFVRHPHDRMVSLFYLLRSITGIKNFKDFVVCAYTTWKRGKIPPIGSFNRKGLSQLNRQVDWLWRDGQPFVHFIGRYERLQQDYAMLCRLLYVDPANYPLPHNHKSKVESYKAYYLRNPDCIDPVYEMFEPDFVQLGYLNLYDEEGFRSGIC